MPPLQLRMDTLYKIKPLIFEKVIIYYPGYTGDGYYWLAPGYMVSRCKKGWKVAGIKGEFIVETEEEGKILCQSHYEEKVKKYLLPQ